MARRKTETVYFLRCPDNGLIKIGWTAGDPAGRLSRIRATSPAPVEALASMPGSLAREAALHRRFADDRSHGEWFRPSARLLEYIRTRATPWDGRSSLMAPPRVPARQPDPAEVAESYRALAAHLNPPPDPHSIAGILRKVVWG